MDSEILSALKPQTVREFMEIHNQITKLTNPQKFSRDFCEYTSFLETQCKVGSVILGEFSFEQFLLSKLKVEEK